MDLVCRNVVQDVVEIDVLDVMKDVDMCCCKKCMLDVMALALNNLQQKYVVTERGMLLTNATLYNAQNSVTLYKEIFEAANFVKQNPQHDEYLITLKEEESSKLS